MRMETIMQISSYIAVNGLYEVGQFVDWSSHRLVNSPLIQLIQ